MWHSSFKQKLQLEDESMNYRIRAKKHLFKLNYTLYF